MKEVNDEPGAECRSSGATADWLAPGAGGSDQPAGAADDSDATAGPELTET